MCPACILTIGGGMWIAKKLGINEFISIGLLVLIFSFIIDKFLRSRNKGKVLFPYQRLIIPLVLLFIAILMAKYLI